MAIDIASVEGIVSIAASVAAGGGATYKYAIKKWVDNRRARREEAAEQRAQDRKDFFTAINQLREENSTQHAEGRQWLRESENRTNNTLARMESKQDHLVEKVDKIEDDVANVRERTAYLEGTVGTHI